MDKRGIRYRKFIIYMMMVFVSFLCVLSFNLYRINDFIGFEGCDQVAKFTMLNQEQGSSVYDNNYIRVRYNSSNTNIHFIISPIEEIKICAYVPFARGLTNNKYNVNILNTANVAFEINIKEQLKNIFDTYNDEATYYMIIHKDNLTIEQYIKEHSEYFSGVIYLDSVPTVNFSSNIKLYGIYTDDFIEGVKKCNKLNMTCEYIKGGSTKGFINVEKQKLNELSWQKQQAKSIQMILEMVDEKEN